MPLLERRGREAAAAAATTEALGFLFFSLDKSLERASQRPRSKTRGGPKTTAASTAPASRQCRPIHDMSELGMRQPGSGDEEESDEEEEEEASTSKAHETTATRSIAAAMTEAAGGLPARILTAAALAAAANFPSLSSSTLETAAASSATEAPLLSPTPSPLSSICFCCFVGVVVFVDVRSSKERLRGKRKERDIVFAFLLLLFALAPAINHCFRKSCDLLALAALSGCSAPCVNARKNGERERESERERE